MESQNLGLNSPVCRACLKLGVNNISILSIHKATSLSYLYILGSCTSVQVNADDDLPKQICQKCLNRILSFYIFKNKVKENDLKLRQILNVGTRSEATDTNLEGNATNHSKLELDSRNTHKTSVKEQDSCIENKLPELKLCNTESIKTNETYKDFEEDTKHLEVLRDQNYINRNDPCQCNVCGKILTNRSLKQHYQKHTGKRPFTCDLCGKKFLRSEHLVDHKRTHTGEKPYNCKLCPKSFRQKGALRAHERIHNDESPFICYVCGKSFKHTSSLRRHKEIHSSETPHTCKICQKSFKNIGYLTVHMRFHSDNKPFSCKLCDKRYFTKSHLNVHLKVHNNIISAKCVICGKGFVRPQHLKLHLITHTGEKAHGCKLCPKKFAQQSHLNRHMKIHKTTMVSLNV